MGASKRHYDLLAIIFVFLMAIVLEYRESFSLLEDETLSYRQLLRAHFGDPMLTAPPDDVVIIYTDEAFYTDYDQYPLTRVDLSTLILRLEQMGASVIGVDMILDFNSAYGEDPTLEDALQETGNVLMVSTAEFRNDRYQSVNRAIPRFDDYTSSGYSNISSNSVIRETIVRLRFYPEIVEDENEWPFAVQAVANHLGEEPEYADHILYIGDLEVPLDHFWDLYIDYPYLTDQGNGRIAKLHEEVGISASDILFLDDEEELEELAFLVEGKIALIGEVAEVSNDEFETPVGNVYGVEIIANTIGTILNNGPLQPASFLVETIVALFLMAFFLLTREMSRPGPRYGLSVGVLALYMAVAVVLYITQGYILSMSYVLMASVMAIAVVTAKFYIAEMGQKAQIRDAFGQYLSPKVVADLVKDPEKLALGGEEREMTAFFSDIAGFSSFSEKITPTELVNVLNDYLTAMCNIIVISEGTIDKFEGDAIIAFWGAPAIQDDHARRTCEAALDMRNQLAPLGELWKAKNYPAISVRMGINSGPMVVGNMGSAQRMDYTIMGDAVNLASRLEGANKAYGSGIMISQNTYDATKDHVDVRVLDTVRVVGKSESVTVYELLERKDQTCGLMADLVHQYEKAHELYHARNFSDAAEAFKLCTSIDAEDGPSQTFLARCRAYAESPPPSDWDGVFELEDKG